MVLDAGMNMIVSYVAGPSHPTRVRYAQAGAPSLPEGCDTESYFSGT